MKTAITVIRWLSYLCVFATIILAIVWYVADVYRIEPITVGLGALSVLLLGVSTHIQNRHLSSSKHLVEMNHDELLSVVESSDPILDWDVSYSEPQVIAVYKEDPDLRIEHEHSPPYQHSDDFREKWANKFPDRHATSYYYDLYFGTTRLKRIILVHVDGGRTILHCLRVHSICVSISFP